MNSQEEFRRMFGSEKLVSLLRDVDRELAQPEDPHIADNSDLLERWENGLLTGEEHDAVLQHLAACHECSQFLGDMIRAGVMHLNSIVDAGPLAETKDDPESFASLVRPASEAERFPRSTRWYTVATAACALMAFIGWFASQSRRESMDVRLADAKFGQLLHYLSQQDFAAIVVPGLAKSGDHSTIEPDAKRDQEIQRLTALTQQSPQDFEYRLNLGQRLLEAGRYDEAESQFRTVAQRQPKNMTARLGIGIVQFRRGQSEAAERTFAAVSDSGPVSDSARVNQVLCLLALQRKREAREVWKSVPLERRDERISRVLAVEDTE